MIPADLILDLARRGVSIDAVGDRLRCRAPRGAASPDLRTAIAESKPLLLALAHGRLEPVPNLHDIGKAYCQRFGGDVVAAFQDATGCDVHERTPSWFDLYVFAAALTAHAPTSTGPWDKPTSIAPALRTSLSRTSTGRACSLSSVQLERITRRSPG